MALVKCSVCGSKVASDAAACPGCGTKKYRRRSLLRIAFFIILVGYVLYAVNRCGDANDRRAAEVAAVEAAKSPAQRAAEAEQKAKSDAEFQFALMAAKAIKANMKNPASFELVNAILLDGGPLCLEYRGTNSFNAVVTQTAVIRRDFKAGDWNRDCANKTGRDMALIRRAM